MNSEKGTHGRSADRRAELWRFPDTPQEGGERLSRQGNELDAAAGRGREPRSLGILRHQDQSFLESRGT